MKTLLALLLLIPSLSCGLTFKDGQIATGSIDDYINPDFVFFPESEIVWPEDTGLLSQKYEISPSNPRLSHSHSWSKEIVRDGEYSIRLEIRDQECGDGDCQRPNFKGWAGRSEYSWSWSKASIGDYWHRWSIYIPESTDPLPQGWTMITQFKTDNSIDINGCPMIPLYFRLDHQGLTIAREVGNGVDCKQQTFETLIANEEDFKGKWLDFVTYTKWSKKDDGFITVWVNGVKRYEYNGITLINPKKRHPPVFRLPIYNGNRLKGHKQTQIVYYDAFYAAKKCKELKLKKIGYTCDALGKETVKISSGSDILGESIDLDKYKSDGFFDEGQYELHWTYIRTDANENIINEGVIGKDTIEFKNGKLIFLSLDNQITDIKKENREKIILNTQDGYFKVDANLDFASDGVTTPMIMIGTLEKDKSGNYYVEGDYNKNERIGISFVPIKQNKTDLLGDLDSLLD